MIPFRSSNLIKSTIKLGTRYSGLILGPVVFFSFLFFLPDSAMPVAAKRMAATALLMAIWWITEAIPIPITALLPIILFPILQILPTSAVTLNYSHHLIYLFHFTCKIFDEQNSPLFYKFLIFLFSEIFNKPIALFG